MAAFALDRAREQYQVAMETLDRVPDRTREQSLRWCLLANKLGMASIFDPLSLSDDVTIFERAVTLARSLGDANALARAHYWLGYMCYGFGRFREGETHTRGRRWRWRARSATSAWRPRSKPRWARFSPRPVNTTKPSRLLDAAVSAKQQRSRPGGGIAIGSAYALSCKAQRAGRSRRVRWRARLSSARR